MKEFIEAIDLITDEMSKDDYLLIEPVKTANFYLKKLFSFIGNDLTALDLQVKTEILIEIIKRFNRKLIPVSSYKLTLVINKQDQVRFGFLNRPGEEEVPPILILGSHKYPPNFRINDILNSN